MRPHRDSPEDALQRSVVAYLRLALPKEAVWWATPNGGYRDPVTAALLQAAGVEPGIPDLFVLFEGRLIGVELKAPPKRLKSGKLSQAKGRLSNAQKVMIPRLAQAGCPTLVCQSLDEVQQGLAALGVPLRASTGRTV